MISAGEFRKGMTVEIDGSVWSISDFQHVKPGKGAAFVRTRLKNVMTGAVLERTFNPTDKYPPAHIETKEMQYLYEDGGLYYFMDTETFEQPAISKETLGDAVKFLKEGIEVKLTYFGSEPIDVELPTSVDFKVVQSEVAVRGDTATGVSKKVKVETGEEFSVPAFIDTGDIIRIDTRTGEYVTRVQNA